MKSMTIEYPNKSFKSTGKKVYFIVAAFMFLFTLQSSAQVSINVNIGSRPDWCSDDDYDNVDYYYLPEIEAYYDTHASVFIYFGPRGWIRSRYLPEYCHNYDLNRGYKVVIDYHGNAPYVFYNHHKVKYYRDGHRNYRQEYYYPNRRQCRSNNYVVATNYYNNDHHDYYKKEKHRGHDNDDRGRDNYRGNDRGNGHGRR
jgi:hypothetical protein